MFKSPIEWLIEALKDLIQNFADAAFKWLKIYLLKPTSLKGGYLEDVNDWVLGIAIGLMSVLLAYNMLKYLFQNISGNSSRSGQEIMVRTFFGVALASGAPFIMTDVLLKINNAYCKALLSQGVDVEKFSKLILNPSTANLAITFAAFTMAVCYLVLAIQYIIRQAELCVLFVGAPLAGISIVNEDMNIWPIWWREVVAVVFTQAFQLTILYIILNQVGNAKDLNGYIMAIGLTIVLITGPKYLRTFIYSTGAGKSMVGAAQGAGKMAIYKYAASKVAKVPVKAA
ncbi:conjugal transfer protein TrbL family protein [Priestia megaterium]|uniref:conjugal transfer protein TrbL family protein n=1 Tax=Priestia megaterium TaxID=1404 RepID=UPI0031FC97C5